MAELSRKDKKLLQDDILVFGANYLAEWVVELLPQSSAEEFIKAIKKDLEK